MAASRPRVPRGQLKLQPGETLCDHCTAKCCRYFALPLDEPTDREDYEYLRWFLMHEDATIFVDEGTWYLLVYGKCKHLQPDQRCGIYAVRPQVCRDYSTENCEYDDDLVYDRYFETPEQLEEYIEAVLPPADGQDIRSPRPALLPIIG